MKVPLSAQRLIQNNRQYVEVWADGQRNIVPSPFLPYYFTTHNILEWPRPPSGIVRVTSEKVRALSDITTTTDWLKVEVATVQDVTEVNKLEGVTSVRNFAENHLGFMERILIDEPNWFERFPNRRPLRLLTFDIEQLSRGGGWPTLDDPLASIAWSCDVGGQPDAPINFARNENKDLDDRQLISTFFDAYRAFDPDVIVGYNVVTYDLTVLMGRMKRLGMDLRRLSRMTKEPWKDVDHKGFEEITIPGRVVYDVLKPVQLDQMMFGIKNRKLKTVAEWMKLPVIIEDTTRILDLLNSDPERLKAYNSNDVFITRAIGRSYWDNYVSLAEFLGAPLNLLLRATPNFYVTTIQGRAMTASLPRVISDGKNYDRYRVLYDHPDCPRGASREPKPVTGALVAIYKRGLFKPCWKADFGSMYPTIMISLGLGADNTRFVGFESAGPFHIDVSGSIRRYSFPDHGWNHNLVIEVNGLSPMALKISEILRHRLALKALRKGTTDPVDKARLLAQENALKIILNSIYGVQASGSSRYSSLAVGITITATARLLITEVERALGDTKCELDTDGIFCDSDPNMTSVDYAINEFAHKNLGLDSHVFSVDKEEYEGAFFSEQKTYLLWKKGGKLEKHGQAFKSSAACGIFDKTLDEMAKSVFAEDRAGTAKLVKEFSSLSSFDQKDFIMRVKAQDVSAYKAQNSIGAQVARSYAKTFNRKIGARESVEYVKTTKGYEVATDEAFRNLDLDYYKEIVVKLGKRFGVETDGKTQQSLAGWF